MKMYYRIPSSSPLSNFKQRSFPNQFYTHQYYLFLLTIIYLPTLLFGSQTELCFISSGYPLLFPIVKFFYEEPFSCYFKVPKYPMLLSTTKNVDTERKSKITPTADAYEKR